MQAPRCQIYGDCQAMAAGEKLFDWAAENLAYATLVDGCTLVLLAGKIWLRFLIYAVIHNQLNGSPTRRCKHIHNGQGAFRVCTPQLV